jgi:hypothetical protein
VYNKDKLNYLIKKQLMNFLRKIISESISNVFEVADKSQKEIAVNKLASILNSLEFKDDVLRAGGDRKSTRLNSSH